MSAIAKIQHKGQVTIPTRVRKQAGLAEGDLVEFSVKQGTIVITPKAIVDRSGFPNADDQYTPEQRRDIDSQLDEAAKGPFHGPFGTADEMIAYMKSELKKRADPNKPKRA